jgi:hypothetical protein
MSPVQVLSLILSELWVMAKGFRLCWDRRDLSELSFVIEGLIDSTGAIKPERRTRAAELTFRTGPSIMN